MQLRSAVCVLQGQYMTLRPTKVWPRVAKEVRPVVCCAPRDGDVPLFRKHGFNMPARLLKLKEFGGDCTLPHTIYTIRLSTGWRRGAALLDDAGVMVCLIGKDSIAVLQRVSPLNDPEENERELKEICKVADNDSGANCALALNSTQKRKTNKVTKRFQEGSVDEVSFLGPELGPLTAVIVGPEAGSWYLDEVNVVSSRTRHSDRFVCREYLGERRGKAAAHLTPVPAEAVVYGTGDSTVILSKEQAAQLRALGMEEYGQLKERLVGTTLSLVGAGVGITFTIGGPALAAPFAVGGAAGLLYQWMLHKGVNSLPLAQSEQVVTLLEVSGILPLAQGRPPSAFGNPSTRVAIALGAAVGLYALQQIVADQSEVGHGVDAIHQVLSCMLGFLMYKLSVISVTVMPKVTNTEPAYERKRT